MCPKQTEKALNLLNTPFNNLLLHLKCGGVQKVSYKMHVSHVAVMSQTSQETSTCNILDGLKGHVSD